MELFGKIVAITFEDLTRCDDGPAIMTPSCYDKLVTRESVVILQRACRGKKALVDYSSLPERFRTAFVAKYGDPTELLKDERMNLNIDIEARRYFAGEEQDAFRLPSGGRLTDEYITAYTINASVLNALRESLNTQKMTRRALNNYTPVVWENIYAYSEKLRDQYHHTLPANSARLRDKLRQYTKEGYDCLISKKFCNRNTLKITEEAGKQIIALRRSRVPVYTTKQIFTEYNRLAVTKGWKPLKSENSLIQYLERPEIKPKWYDAVYGELAAKQLFARQHKTELPRLRDALWYGDGTKLNLYYKAFDTTGAIVVKTTSVYEVIDAFSETLLGYCISDSENYDAQYRAFRMAIEYAQHKPYEIVHDNQGGHKKLQTAGFMQRICRVARPTTPYNGPSKTIESVFGRFQSQVLHKDWRFTGQNITSRKRSSRPNMEFIEANKDSLYTYQELLQAYAACRAEWNRMPHFATGIAREDMYRTSVNPETQAVDRLDMMEMFWLTTAKPSIFTARGIEITVGGKTYTYEVFAEGMPDMNFRRTNTGREFFVKYDPLDMGMVELCTKDATGIRNVTTAYPYKTIHRDIQSQVAGDALFIRAIEEQNAAERVRRQQENYELEIAHGVAPEQYGLRSPRLKGLSNKKVEELSDKLLAADRPCEPIDIGTYTKTVSNMTFDETAILSRL